MIPKHILLATSLCLAAFAQAVGSPTIIAQPESRSVDLGGEVVFSVTAVSELPIGYQWRKGTNDLPDETLDILFFANVQTTDAGDYTVVVSDTSGSVTSQVATLTVGAAFTKISTGAIVNDGGASASAAWTDYDNDGWLDLFVANTLLQNDFLYHNNGNGTFTRITNSIVANDGVDSRNATWADYDNDGHFDLFMTTPGNELLYRNNGDGTFTRITDGIVVNDGGASNGTSWADYDNDGDLDLLVSNNPGPKFLYRNDGNGTFSKVTTGILVTDPGNFAGNTWGDYDNDGDLDLFVSGAGNNSVLYRNDGGGNFTKITEGILVNEGGGFGCAWGDYDNDGWLDLFVCVGGSVGPANSFLYHNNGDGTFTKITSGDIVTNSGNWTRGAWGDYDNDSFLDLFVSNYAGNNALYRNNGNGTFTKIATGSVVNDGGQSSGCGWGDFDNDGFLDLFVANGRATGNENNFLYRNNGNSNSWIKLRLGAYLSNRSGVGAKIKVNAVIGGTDRWLTRSIDGSDVNGNASALVVGLGDATNVNTLRIEWPSGLVQELHDVATNQFLTVLETTNGPPIFYTQPQGLSVLPGSHVTLQALVASFTPPSYQWLKDGLALAEATNAALSMANLQVLDSGTYVLAVSNAAGSVTSQPALLTVGPILITLHPRSQNIRLGSNVTFTVSATNNGPPLHYQWQLNGANLAGPDGDSLTISNVQLANEGDYSVVVSDNTASLASLPATLTALIRPVIVQPPLSQTVVAGGSVTVSVVLTGHPPPFLYQWRRGTGTLTNILTSEKTCFFTLANLQAEQGGLHRLVISNAAASTVNSTFTLTVLADADTDGLPDLWEGSYGVTDPATDADGDGMSNVGEYVAGTNPTNALSYLKIDSIEPAGGAGGVMLRFDAVSNKTYTVEHRLSVDSGAWNRLADVAASASSRTVEIPDPTAGPGSPRRVYRLVTPRAP